MRVPRGFPILARIFAPAVLLIASSCVDASRVLGPDATATRIVGANVAASGTVFGPQRFSRTTAAPVTTTVQIPTAGFGSPLTLHVRDGDGAGGNAVASATVKLDGVTLINPSMLTSRGGEWSFNVNTGAAAVLVVRLEGKPGGYLDIWIDGGYVAPPPAVLTPSPASIAFAATPATTASAPTTVTVTNTGGSPSGAVSTVLSGVDASAFAIGSNTCAGVTLAIGQSCTLQVTFAPATTGAKAATLSLGGAGTVTVPMTGTATAAPPAATLSLSPTSVNFGTVLIGNSRTATATLTNTSGVSTSPITVSLGGPDALAFAITSDPCSGLSLAVGATCVVEVQFAPVGTAGIRSATMTVTGGIGVTASANLLGAADFPPSAVLTPSPASIAFAATPATTASAPTTVTVTNTGGSPSGALSAVLSGVDASAFAIGSNTCTGVTLAIGQACTLEVTFAPATTGAKAATLSLGGAGTVTVPLTGTATAAPPPAALSLSSTSINFSLVLIGSTGTSAPITVTNTGGSATTPLSAVFTGANAGEFAVAVAGSTCVGTVLAPAATCIVRVQLTPVGTAGTRSATMTVTGGIGVTASANLLGAADFPPSAVLTPSPASIAFAATPATTASAPTTVTVTNTGGSPSGALSAVLSGVDASAFAIGSNTCTGVTLAIGQACTLQVTFAPATTGAKAATLSLGGAGTVTVPLTGTATAAPPPAALSLSLASVNFGTVLTGTSTVVTVTLTNTGGVSTSPITLSLGGPDALAFAITSDPCSGVSLGAGATCTVQLKFSPLTAGIKSATFSASGGGVVSASLSGMGI